MARRRRGLLFYPSRSIGNFAPDAASRFVSRIRVLCGSDGSLLGMDLVKDKGMREAARDDARGIKAVFDLNILNSVDRILDSDFDVREWRHVARQASASRRSRCTWRPE